MNTSHLKWCCAILLIYSPGPLPASAMAFPYCPPGFIRNLTEADSKEEGHCVCSKHLEGILDCDKDSGAAQLAIGYCMTLNFSTNTTIVGKCPYNSNYTSIKNGRAALYLPLPDSVFDLDEYLCGGYNRRGILCSQCHHHRKSSVTSYSLECIPCERKHRNLGRVAYICLQALPVTFLYIVIIVFDIRFTKNPWSVFILFSQIVVNMLNYDRKLYSHLLYVTDGSNLLSFLSKFVLAFYGFWNLYFLPNILPPFCLDIPTKGRHELLYEYFVALYPLFLIALIYFCVHLYARDVKLIVVLWKAIKYCLNFKVCCGSRWILKRISSQSIAHSFTSFLVLAYPKILFVSLDLLLPIRLYELDGNTTTNSLVLYNAPYMPYFGSMHLPYALFAVFVFVVCTTLPTLLLILHPVCAHRYFCRTCLSLRLFVESFQGWFKDGTETGTRDFRILAGLHPLVRIMTALYISLIAVLVQPSSPFSDATWLGPGLVFICFSLFFALARPYKLQYMNAMESLLLALLGAISLLVSYRIGFYIAIVIGVIPMLTVIGYSMYRLFKIVKQHTGACKSIGARFRVVPNENTSLLTDHGPFIADRLENPAHYLEHSVTNDSKCTRDSSKVSDGSVSINIDVTPVYTYGSADNRP